MAKFRFRNRRRFNRRNNRNSNVQRWTPGSIRMLKGLSGMPRKLKWRNPIHCFTRSSDGNVASLTSAVGGGNGATYVKSGDGNYCQTGNAGVSNLTYYSLSLCFTLDSLPDYTEFTNLFDRYKITGVRVRMMPFGVQTPLKDTNLGNQGLSWLAHSVFDYDDTTLLAASNTGVQLMRERSSYQIKNMLDPTRFGFQRFIRPRQALATYSGAFTSYANTKALWNDTASPSVQHYGMKIIFECFSPDDANNQYLWHKVDIKYYLKLKDPI